MRVLVVTAMAVVLMLGGCTAAAPAGAERSPFSPGAESAGDPYFPTLGNGGYDVAGYDLKLGYDPESGRLDGTATVTASATQNLSQFSLDLDRGLTVQKVTVDGRAAGSSFGGGKVRINPAGGVAKGAGFTAVVRYSGMPGRHWAGQRGRAGTWFPANDQLADKAGFTLEITVPDGETAVSNGVPGRRTTAGGRTTWRWRQTAPIATHLAFVALGDVKLTTTTHSGKPLLTTVQDNARTGEIADWLAEAFGPYPFGAYEATTGDSSAAIAGELARRWFGDSVTPARWSDIWLSEGFATYARWLWIEHDGGPTVDETFRERYENFPWQAMPAADPGVDNLYSSGPRDRGAMTLHALRARIGEGPFFALLRDWAVDHTHGTVDTGDFVAAAERMSGQSLGKFFDVWLAGTYRPTY